MDELRSIVQKHPLLDNHAHNFLLPAFQNDSAKFLSIASEAEGDALADSVHSLAHITARRQLQELYDCQSDDWASVTEARARWLQKPDALYRKCLDGTHAILMDDGLDGTSVQPYDWHDKWIEGQTHRILRIEADAESIVREKILPKFPKEGVPKADSTEIRTFFDEFLDEFTQRIKAACRDSKVVAFKSVIGYRSGLDVNVDSFEKVDAAREAFATWLMQCRNNANEHASMEVSTPVIKLNSKVLNDYILEMTLWNNMIIGTSESFVKPIQYHTGLGDNDLKLTKANPAHLQPFISKYSDVPFVLLHASYPYTREAGYLATVYSNVYLDLGLVFPMVSLAGQMSVVRQALELTPWNKLLYSSDGHWFPETYWLAAKQFRLVLEEVLIQSVEDQSLAVVEAINAAKGILFDNSNRLYKLGIALRSAQAMTTRNEPSLSKRGTNTTPIEPAAAFVKNSSAAVAFQEFIDVHKFLEFVYVQWFDYMGTMRARIVPLEEFWRIIESKNKMSISRGNTGTLQNDSLTKAVNTTGHMVVTPDLQSLKPTHPLDPLRNSGLSGRRRSSATVLASWCDDQGNGIPACPRKTLLSTLGQLRNEYGIDVTLGFEVEVTFLNREGEGKYVSPVTENHAWSTLSPEQWHGMGAIRDIYDGLREIGVEVQGIHAEAGPSQYEFILPPASAVNAIDTLLQARQVIRQIAYTRGLRATLHPKFANGAHIHMSLRQQLVDNSDGLSEKTEQSFFAGVLAHLRAACAFTLPAAESYLRVADNVWSGGRWVAWGTQNRECPLRKVRPGRWEFKPHDGMGNVYLAVGAVMASGLLGLREGMDLTLRDCAENPSRLDKEGRKLYGIVHRMPGELGESLEALRGDRQLQEVIGESLISDYILMKEAEQDMLSEMSELKREQWLIERY